MQIRMRTREQGKAEKSLRAMTDIDDDQVIRVTRAPPSTTYPTDSLTEYGGEKSYRVA